MKIQIIIPSIFWLLILLTTFLAITIGNLAGMWLLFLGVPWSFLTPVEHAAEQPQSIIYMYMLVPACFNGVIISVVSWFMTRKKASKLSVDKLRKQ